MTSITFFFIFIPILAIVLLAINLIFAPHNPYNEKDSAFECGFHSFLGQNRTQFSISFFIFALLFLLFDLEILLVYPYVVSAYVNGIYGLTIMLIFFLALTLGFAFELGKNALKIESRQSSTLDSNHTEINKVVGLKSNVCEPSFFAFIPGVTKFVVTPLMLYLPVLISTITKMIIQNAKIMGTGLFTKIIGTGLRLLNDKYIMPLLIKFFRVFILRLAGLWPNILYYDKRYFKKIIDKAFPGLKILVKLVVIFYISYLFYRIYLNILDFNSKGGSLEYGLSLIKNDCAALQFFF